MARDTLNGMYFWPRDILEEEDIISVYEESSHWCLWNTPDAYKKYTDNYYIAEDEMIISPECMVTWK